MFYPTVNGKKVHYLHKRGIKLFTWTVNDAGKADQLKRKGVDGIITDYPNIIK
jgi:glycerophosphoryl diester phosphodiesterase